MFLKFIGLLILCLLLLVLAIGVRLLATDARRRGKPPVLVVLLAFVSFPLGLLLWLVFRPERVEHARSQFRLGDHRVQ